MVALAALGLVVVAVASLSNGPRPFSASTATPTVETSQPARSSGPNDAATPEPDPTESHSPDAVASIFGLISVLAEIAAVLIAMFVIGAMVTGSRWGGRHTGGRRGSPATPFQPPTDEVLADAINRGLAELMRGSPSDAIVNCWRHVEEAAVSAGVELHASDTAGELADRIVITFGAPGEALGHLAGLYREARFSTHTMTEQARADAGRCLRDIQRDLRVRN